jgi:hypothetical protein
MRIRDGKNSDPTACLDPDPDRDSQSGSADPLESGSNTDPKHWRRSKTLTLYSIQRQLDTKYKFPLIGKIKIGNRNCEVSDPNQFLPEYFWFCEFERYQ